MPEMKTVATLGYEGASIDSFIHTLKHHGIETVIDVRALPLSRKKGFSKAALSKNLTNAGIDYVHIKALGNPKAGRDAAYAGNMDLFTDIFSAHMKEGETQIALKRATDIAMDSVACLLCYERDHQVCHRSIIADAMHTNAALTINHLNILEESHA